MNATPQLHTELAQRLLMSALREQDAARAADEAAERATCLARVSRDLAHSLDEAAIRETIGNVRLPRPGSWSIVDILEPDGLLHRLPVAHPDAAKADLAMQLQHRGPAGQSRGETHGPVATSVLLNGISGEALLDAVHGESNLSLLNRIGFGYLLVLPLIVRAQVHGTIIFVSPPGSAKFTADETALAVDIAARCALALDNARLYHQADSLRVAAQQANQSKSEFLSAMSHELRTPLNAIGGFADLMELGIQGPVTEEQQKSLGRIKANQKRLLILISEILSFARIESGRTNYETGEVALPAVLDSVTDMLSQAIAEAGLTVDGPSGAARAVAWADPDRVGQIFVNLIMNALKYAAAPGGTLTLRCAHTKDVVTASIADSGPGIPPEKLETIFEPFVQLPATDKHQRGGVGLGLAISRDLARGMKGDLVAANGAGGGAVFTLTLPRARERLRLMERSSY